MRVLVDADACPVREIIVRLCREKHIPLVMVTDTSHRIDDGYSRVITVDKGRDSADLRLANEMEKGDAGLSIRMDFCSPEKISKGCSFLVMWGRRSAGAAGAPEGRKSGKRPRMRCLNRRSANCWKPPARQKNKSAANLVYRQRSGYAFLMP